MTRIVLVLASLLASLPVIASAQLDPESDGVAEGLDLADQEGDVAIAMRPLGGFATSPMGFFDVFVDSIWIDDTGAGVADDGPTAPLQGLVTNPLGLTEVVIGSAVHPDEPLDPTDPLGGLVTSPLGVVNVEILLEAPGGAEDEPEHDLIVVGGPQDQTLYLLGGAYGDDAVICYAGRVVVASAARLEEVHVDGTIVIQTTVTLPAPPLPPNPPFPAP